MLVLQREPDETIVLSLPDGRRITAMVIRVRGDKVRIGIDAPQDVQVHRGEVQDRLDRGEWRPYEEGGAGA